MSKCGRCCSRIPWATLFAIILNICGLIAFTTALFNILETVQDLMGINLYATYVVSGIWIVMIIIDIWFFIIAIPFTGSTRDDCCKQAAGACFGRCCITLNIVVAFLLNLCLVIFSCLLSVVVVLLLGTTILCKAAERLGKDACAVLNDLKVLYFNGTTGACEGRGVCIKIEETWGSSLGTFVGSLVICMSMVIFVMTLSANFTHLEHRIKDSKREKFHDENGTEMSNM